MEPQLPTHLLLPDTDMAVGAVIVHWVKNTGIDTCKGTGQSLIQVIRIQYNTAALTAPVMNISLTEIYPAYPRTSDDSPVTLPGSHQQGVWLAVTGYWP